MRIAAYVVALGLFVGAAACAGVGKNARWSPYQGCNRQQCVDWADACEAECINAHTMSVTECQTKCQARVPACEAECSG